MNKLVLAGDELRGDTEPCQADSLRLLSSLFRHTPCIARWYSWRACDEDRSRSGLMNKRRTEHIMGRRAAHSALTAQGGKKWAGASIDRDRDGCPVWPIGIVGSIAHTKGLAVSAVASAATVAGVGIDVETIRPTNSRLGGRVMRPEDFDHLPPRMPAHVFVSVFFSVREAVFKCVFPALRTPLDWADCRVRMNWANRTFTASVEGAASVTGRIRINERHVASACWSIAAMPTDVLVPLVVAGHGPR